jgi:GT2 family glycosyltransferase
MRERTHDRPAARYRRLLHELNQRYRREFDRAERLRAELEDIRGSRAWRFLSWCRRVRGLWAGRPPSAPAAGPASQPLALPPAPPGPAEPAGRVDIIIPFRDRVDLLRGCLVSLRRGRYRRWRATLVDNGSTEPATRRFLDRLKGRRRYRVISCPGPFNFSRLCNTAAHRARGEWLLFLNNDVEALADDWLGRMLAAAAAPGVGVVGATLLYPDGTIQHAGLEERDGQWVHVYRGWPANHFGERRELLAVRAVPAVTGACLLLRRRLFLDLGGFDERLPVTHNDVDLCRRVRERGLTVAVTPHARLIHYESLSRGYTAEPARV